MSFASASPRRFPSPRALRAAHRALALLAACLGPASAARLAAQNPGDIDPAPFSAVAIGYNIYTQVQEYPGGVPYIVVGGDRGGIDFLSAVDGSFNNTGIFNFPDFGAPSRIIYTAVPEQVAPPSGDAPYLLVGGQFGRSGSQILAKQAAQGIFRLTPFGVIDTTFNPGKGTNGFVTSIVPLSDGGMIVAGDFETFNGQPHLRIVRLDHDGTVLPDSAFDTNLSFDAPVLSVAVQVGTGQIQIPQFVVAGQFSNVNGSLHQKLARINYDGSVDGTFNPTFDDRTTVVATQPDGKILVGGDFSNVNGEAHKHIVRLNYDGSVDPTFVASVTGQPFGFIDPPAVYVIKLLPDGSMYLGGNFTTVDGSTRNYLARVNADGTLDPVFDPQKNIINAVQSLSIQRDGKLLVGETVSKKNGNNVQPPSLIRLYAEPPTVVLQALKPTATETPRKFGSFKLKRSGPVPITDPLTVYLKLTAPANSGQYFKLGNKLGYDQSNNLYVATIAPGATNFKFAVNTTGVPLAGVNQVPVALTVVAAPTGVTTYQVGSTATVTITNQ